MSTIAPQGDHEMGKISMGPFSAEVTPEAIEKTVESVSRFNPMVIVSLMYTTLAISAMAYLHLVIQPANTQAIGEKIEPLTKAISDNTQTQTTLLRDLVQAVSSGAVQNSSNKNGSSKKE